MSNMVSKNGIVQDKKAFKKKEGSCKICGCAIYSTLSIHRINPGEKGGKYHDSNTVVTCENCHRRIHDGEIVIDRYYPSTAGKKFLRIIENGEERFI